MPQAGRHARDAGAGHDGALSSRVHPSRHRVPQRLERKGAVGGVRGDPDHALLRRQPGDAVAQGDDCARAARAELHSRGSGRDPEPDLRQRDGRHLARLSDAHPAARTPVGDVRAREEGCHLRRKHVRPHRQRRRARALPSRAQPGARNGARALVAHRARRGGHGARQAARGGWRAAGVRAKGPRRRERAAAHAARRRARRGDHAARGFGTHGLARRVAARAAVRGQAVDFAARRGAAAARGGARPPRRRSVRDEPGREGNG
mmetsp:Transcript_37133/g.116225  ORF Transcript_37133/g.116225 Transcript_37133/m.116225 type:complete len:262 (-) Transcript_37133:2118-2903(-)